MVSQDENFTFLPDDTEGTGHFKQQCMVRMGIYPLFKSYPMNPNGYSRRYYDYVYIIPGQQFCNCFLSHTEKDQGNSVKQDFNNDWISEGNISDVHHTHCGR